MYLAILSLSLLSLLNNDGKKNGLFICFSFSLGIMNTRQQSKVTYSWYGKPLSSDRKLRTSRYK